MTTRAYSLGKTCKKRGRDEPKNPYDPIEEGRKYLDWVVGYLKTPWKSGYEHPGIKEYFANDKAKTVEG